MSLLIWSRFWGFETPSWIQKLQEPIAEPVASNSWIDWLHWTGSSLVVATGCTKRASNAYYRVLSIRPSNYSCTYMYIYIHIWVISSISSACDGGKEVLRLTWCLLPKKCGMPASKVLWSFRQSCTLASSASGFYGIQFLVYAIFAYPYRISNAFKRTMSLCAWYIMIHHAKVWSSNLCPLSLNV